MEREVREALASYDQMIKPCPVNNPQRGQIFRPSDACPRCGVRADQNCGLEASASYHLVLDLRRILGPTPTGSKETGE